MANKKLVRFDWAIKHVLRNKAHFDVLEGFLTALLEEDITVLNILESEGNQAEEDQKFNRVDLLVEDSKKRKIIIEVQNTRQVHYLERILFGTSKVIVDNLKLGDDFSKVAKVISLSLLYFNLGFGDDYLYYGTTEFKGVNSGTPFIVKGKVHSVEECGTFKMSTKNVFPEYYLVRVEAFEDIVKKPVDEWIYMLKNNEILPGFKSKNIKAAEEALQVMNMSEVERRSYERYLLDLASERDSLYTASQEGLDKGRKEGLEEGLEKGRKEGLEKGLEKGRKEIARNLLPTHDNETIAALTGLSTDEIAELRAALQDQ